MPFNMNLLGDSYDMEADRQNLLNLLAGLKNNRLGRKASDKIRNQLGRMEMANTAGTGFLQQRLPFDDIKSIIDPQRRLSLSLTTQDMNQERLSLERTFDRLRSTRGVTKSGFVDFSQQEAERELERRRQRQLFDNEQRMMELSSSLESQNQDVMNSNRQVLFDVFGDKLYDKIRNYRENF